jgi:TRAP-type mannitol/chloroaromatic compound transport system permease large subunit
MLVRVPVFLAIGLAAGTFAPILRGDVLALTFLRGLDNQAFSAIAYFFAVGAIMNEGGMSARLLELAGHAFPKCAAGWRTPILLRRWSLPESPVLRWRMRWPSDP